MGPEEDERCQVNPVNWTCSLSLTVGKQKLQPFFPPLEPLQSLNLRAALFRCISDLKKNGDLGKEVIIRKTMFDDCKGEKLQELLASFSTGVLQKVLAAGQAGEKSIAGQLATAKRITSGEHESFLPLAVAHRASLTTLLRRKKELRMRYQSFDRTLDTKERELDQRFEGVVKTQNFLDENVIPDPTVSRLSALFEEHWQGDSRLVNVVAQGEEHGLGDSLLNRPFQDVWPEISEGTFDGKIGTTQHGLLQDLEKRVAQQEAKLKQWKDFQAAMKNDTKPRISPKKQDLALTRTTSNDAERQKRRERDLVFSPSKSPRKSGWELEGLEVESSPTPSMPKLAKANGKSSKAVSKQLNAAKDGQVEDEASRSQKRRSKDLLSPVSASQDETDDSGFSEVSGGQLHEMASPDNAIQSKNMVELSSPGRREYGMLHEDENGGVHYHKNEFVGPSPPATESAIPSTKAEWSRRPNGNNSVQQLPIEHGPEDNHDDSKEPDEEDLLAEQIVSMTINAAPTPKYPKLTLEERTRQSIAFASPSKFQGLTSDKPPPAPLLPFPAKEDPSHAQASGASTILERTRQSISLLPPKPKTSRKSMHKRRTSKTYPTNQFETPRKQLSSGNESTSPDQLFSPGAGYDSVFKSRPKIAFSPTPSPVPGDGWDVGDDRDAEDDDDMEVGVGKGRWEDSPLTGVAGKV